MTVNSLIIRFFITYLALVFGAVFTLNFFDIKDNIDICRGVLTAITSWGFGVISQLSISFEKRNGRYFTKPEKRLTVAGNIIINLVMQVVLLSIPPFSNSLPGSSFLVFSSFGLLQAAVIYYLVSSTKNKLIQQ